MIDLAIFENYGNGTSVTFNTNTIPFHRFHTYEEYRTEERERPQEHGSWPAYTYIGKRVFEAEGEILEANSTNYITTRRNIKKVLTPAPELGYSAIGKLRLTFTGQEEMYSECTIDGYELPMESLFAAAGEFMITWVAFDPRMYSSVEYTAITGTPNILSGRTYNKTYNKTYGVMSGSNDVICTNSGDIATQPIIDILGPVEIPRLILTRSGVTYDWHLDLNVSAGETIRVDFAKRTVTNLITGSNLYHFISNSVWWSLYPGNNTVTFSAYAASAPAKATIKWHNAYML